MTDAQKVMLGKRIEPDLAERARLRQRAAGYATNANQHTASQLEENFPQAATKSDRVLQVRDEVAKQVGLGTGRTYETGKKLLDEAAEVAPEIMAKAERGEATLRDVRTAVKAAHKAHNATREREQARSVAAGARQVPR